MLICFALMLGLGLADLPAAAAQVEAEAHDLAAAQEATPALAQDVARFAADAEDLARGLERAGIDQDMPRVFDGIAQDARARAQELNAADTPAERAATLARLRLVLEDAALLAPMAAAAAADADASAERKVASN